MIIEDEKDIEQVPLDLMRKPAHILFKKLQSLIEKTQR
jgi:hypothetical protein